MYMYIILYIIYTHILNICALDIGLRRHQHQLLPDASRDPELGPGFGGPQLSGDVGSRQVPGAKQYVIKLPSVLSLGFCGFGAIV